MKCPSCGKSERAQHHCDRWDCPYLKDSSRNMLLSDEYFAWCLRESERSQQMTNKPSPGVRLDTSGDELKMLQDVVIRAHQMTAGNHLQSPEEMLRRSHRLLEAAVEASPVMRGFLGRIRKEPTR